MPRKRKTENSDTNATFGQRMARIRKDAGFTQRALAKEIGISQRMVAYYEGQTDFPPTHLLPQLVQVLGVSADELLGIKPLKDKKPGNQRLWRRVRRIEQLPAKEKRQLLTLIDAFLERDKLQKAG